MTPERVTEMFRRCSAGDRSARRRLIEMHLSMAHGLAHRYRGGLEPIEDLCQVAALGLVKAVDRFDVDRGGSFTAFAVPTILGELKRHFRDRGWTLHVTRDTKELALRIRQVQRELDCDGRVVTVAMLADRLQVDHERITDALVASAGQYTVSFDRPFDDDDRSSAMVGPWLGTDESNYEEVESRDAFASLARGLDGRTQLVLELYHGQELSQLEIGRQIGISQMQVSRIVARAQNRIREQLRAGRPDTPELQSSASGR